MIVWKTSGKDVLETLKAKGYNTNKLRKEQKLSETTIQRLRRNEMVAMNSLDSICGMLKCQPSKIVEWIPDEKTE